MKKLNKGKLNIKSSHRHRLWSFVTGARNVQNQNRGYYQSIKGLYKKYPSWSEALILKDLERTFPDKIYSPNDPLIRKMKNILQAYSWRCPQVGYCQGFNAIVATLLDFFKDEEEVFWVFTQLIECVLPLDYYVNMLGIMADSTVFDGLVEQYLPLTYEKIQETPMLSIELITFAWFVCLYSRTIQNTEILKHIWDRLFTEGDISLFKTGLAIFTIIEPSLLEIKSDCGVIFEHFSEKIKQIKNPEKFIKVYNQIYINQSVLQLLRQHSYQKQKDKIDDQYNNSYVKPRVVFCERQAPFCQNVQEHNRINKPNFDNFVFSTGIPFDQQVKWDYFKSKDEKSKQQMKNQQMQQQQSKSKSSNSEISSQVRSKRNGRFDKLSKPRSLKDFQKLEIVRRSYSEGQRKTKSKKIDKNEYIKEQKIMLGRSLHTCKDLLGTSKYNFKFMDDKSGKKKKIQIRYSERKHDNQQDNRKRSITQVGMRPMFKTEKKHAKNTSKTTLFQIDERSTKTAQKQKKDLSSKVLKKDQNIKKVDIKKSSKIKVKLFKNMKSEKGLFENTLDKDDEEDFIFNNSNKIKKPRKNSINIDTIINEEITEQDKLIQESDQYDKFVKNRRQNLKQNRKALKNGQMSLEMLKYIQKQNGDQHIQFNSSLRFMKNVISQQMSVKTENSYLKSSLDDENSFINTLEESSLDHYSNEQQKKQNTISKDKIDQQDFSSPQQKET